MFLCVKKSETGMWSFVNMIWLGTEKCWSNHHSLSLCEDSEAEMMAEERIGPGLTKARGAEQTKVVGMFVQNTFAVDKVAKKIVRKTASQDFGIAS